jgi:hypothetical protein
LKAIRFPGFPALAVGDSLPVSNRAIACLLLFCLGSVLYIGAYGSVQPLLAALIYFALGSAALALLRSGYHEREMYRIVFAVGFFMSSVSAVYVNVFQDEGQLFSDAGNFYALSSGLSQGLSLEDLSTISEGAGAIVLWRFIYDTFHLLGFEKGRFIGILVNVMCVSLTGVLSVKILKHVRPGESRPLERLIRLFPWMGIFWLFASLHMRDAVILLGVTALMYYWVRYLAQPRPANLALLALATLAGFGYFGTLRTEFAFVPAAMLAAGLCASLLYNNARGLNKVALFAIIFFSLCAMIAYIVVLKSDLMSELTSGYDTYKRMTGERDNAGNSLGNALIVKAALPVRLVFGTVYLFVFPIPFWLGFQLESAYHLFKSLNVLFYYATLPLFGLAMLGIRRKRIARTPPLMFLVFVFAGFTIAIAMTSLETRHFGSFQAAFAILAAIPDLDAPGERARYRQLLATLILVMGTIHVAWICLKLI